MITFITFQSTALSMGTAYSGGRKLANLCITFFEMPSLGVKSRTMNFNGNLTL